MKFKITIIVYVLFCITISCINGKTDIKEPNIESLIKEGEEYLSKLDFANAEKKFLSALEIKSTADIYVHLFRTYIAQDKTLKAENTLNLALELDPNNKNALFIKAKYEFVNSKGGKIRNVINLLELAHKNEHPQAKYLKGTIQYLEKYKKATLNWDYREITNLTFPEAVLYYYNSFNEAISDSKKVYDELKKANIKYESWDYMLPFNFFTNDDQNIITKIISSTTFIDIEQRLQHTDQIILISIDDGENWYSLIYDKGYYDLLLKYFNKENLDKIFYQ